jgi:hypothetical protein
VQPSPSQWDWSAYDRLFAAARANRVGVILTPTDAPCWAHPAVGCAEPSGRAAQPPDVAFNEAWYEFIRAVVGRYPDLTGLEVWNEPNSNPFWAPSPNPERYTELLRLAYVASKSVRPDVPVLFGGLAPITGSSPGQIDNLEFLRRAYDAGAAAYFNAIAIHPYPLPFSRPDYRQRTLRLIAGVRRMVRRRQGIRLPIWVTEIGISTDGPGAVSDRVQARRLRKLYLLLGRVPDLPVVVVHRLLRSAGTRRLRERLGADARQPHREAGLPGAAGRIRPLQPPAADSARLLEPAGTGREFRLGRLPAGPDPVPRRLASARGIRAAAADGSRGPRSARRSARGPAAR